MREPLTLSLRTTEVSHISDCKSSITLRCFNMSWKEFNLNPLAKIGIIS